MKITSNTKGILLAFISVIAVSNVYLFSKAALSEVELAQFGVYWFGFGLLWILVYACYKKTFRNFKHITTSEYLVLTLIGLFEIVGTYFFFKAIHTISNPAIVSFIGNISPVFIIILSFIFLNERFLKFETIGMLLALIGAFIISFKKDTNVSDMFIDGAQYVLFSSFFTATTAVLAKKNIKKINPIIFTISRTLFLLIFSVAVLFYLKLEISIPSSALKNIFIGSLLGPFLTVIAGFLALQYIPLSKRAIISSTRGFFVLLGAYLYFNIFPNVTSVIGGITTIVGLLIIASVQSQKKTNL